jgi:site-specific DNA-cytosine methylase
MLIFDFFAGTGSATKAFEDKGHTIIKVELLDKYEANERDVLTLNAAEMVAKYGHPDFIWASPPCTTFSVASCPIYWHYVDGVLTPKDDRVFHGIAMVKKAISLIEEIKPKLGWIIENPRGMLRKQDFMQSLPRRTITYCQYGDFRMKPTDLWGIVPGWESRPMCKAGASCHENSPRGTNTGNQRLSKTARSMIPYELGNEICNHLERL